MALPESPRGSVAAGVLLRCPCLPTVPLAFWITAGPLHMGAQATRVGLWHPPALPENDVPRPLNGVRELPLGVLQDGGEGKACVRRCTGPPTTDDAPCMISDRSTVGCGADEPAQTQRAGPPNHHQDPRAPHAPGGTRP